MAELGPKLVTNDDPNAVVECRVCGDSKEARSMPGHVGSAHKLKVPQYVETYGQESGRDFYFSGAPKGAASKPESIEEEALGNFTKTERAFYDSYSQEIFEQIDRDVAQLPIVMSLTMDMVLLNRIRSQMDSWSSPKAGTKVDLPDSKTIDAMVRNHKYCEERIRAQMKSLGLDRESKLKNKAQIKTTPFSLLSGYLVELERMTPPQLQTMENEERKLYTLMRERIDKLYLSTAPDIVEEKEEEDGALSSLDVDRIISEANIEI